MRVRLLAVVTAIALFAGVLATVSPPALAATTTPAPRWASDWAYPATVTPPGFDRALLPAFVPPARPGELPIATAAGANLDTLLAIGAVSDPLALTPTIIRNDSFVQISDDRELGQTVRTPDGRQNTLTGPELYRSGYWDVAQSAIAADIDADGIDELVSVYDQLAGSPTEACIGIAAQDMRPDAARRGLTVGCAREVSRDGSLLERQAVRLAKGNFFLGRSAGAGQQVVMAWNGRRPSDTKDKLCLEVFDNSRGSLVLDRVLERTCGIGDGVATMGEKQTIFDRGYEMAGRLAVAAGDLDGDGLDEIVVAWMQQTTEFWDGRDSETNIVRIEAWKATASGLTRLASGALPAVNPSFRTIWLDIALGVARTGAVSPSGVPIASIYLAGAASGWNDFATRDNTAVYAYQLSLAGSALTPGSQQVVDSCMYNCPDTLRGSVKTPWGGLSIVVAPLRGDFSKPDVGVLYSSWFPQSGTTLQPTLRVRLYDRTLTPVTEPLDLGVISDGQWGWPGSPWYAIPHRSGATYRFPTAGNLLPTPQLVVSNPQDVNGAYFYSRTRTWSWNATAGRFDLADTFDTQRNLRPRDRSLRGTVGLALGNFYGNAASLQLETVRRFSQFGQVQALLLAPPSHVDWFPERDGGVEINANSAKGSVPDPPVPPHPFFSAPTAEYINGQSQQTAQTVSFERKWAISADANLGGLVPTDVAFALNAALKANYGQNFTTTTKQIDKVQTRTGVTVKSDDYILYTESQFLLYEYTMRQNGAVKGRIAVAWPETVCPTVRPTCQLTNVVSAGRGGNQFPTFRWQTEPGNVLSYPRNAPGDVANDILNQRIARTTGQAFSIFTSREASTVRSEETSSELGLSAQTSFGRFFKPGEGSGGTLGLNGSYGEKSISNQTLQFDKDSSLKLDWPSLPSVPRYPGVPRTPTNPGGNVGAPNEWGYEVEPFLYFSQGTFMRLNYRVRPLTSSLNTVWQMQYTLPDPAFILRLPYSGANRFYSTDVDVTPVVPRIGRLARISATVRNFSLTDIDIPAALPGMSVEFFRGDPRSGGILLATRSVNRIQAGSSADVSIDFTPAAACSRVWVRLNNNNAVPGEVHKGNNLAWNLVAALPATGGPAATGDNVCINEADDLTLGAPFVDVTSQDGADLSIVPGALAVTRAPRTAPAGQIALVATIRGTGGTFANSDIAFWRGDPRTGAEFICNEVVPLIYAGFSATANCSWDATGFFGNQQICVTAATAAGDDVRIDDNLACRVLALPLPVGYAVFPFISRGGSFPIATPQAITPSKNRPRRYRLLQRPG